MQDVFDGGFKEELDGLYEKNLWSELSEGTVNKILEAIKNSLRAYEMKIPSEKEVLRRAKGFYSNRRSLQIIKKDEDKRRKRKLAMKVNRSNFVSC